MISAEKGLSGTNNEADWKNTRKYWGWLFLALFLTDSWWIGDSVVLYLTGRPVPLWQHAFFLMLFFLLSLFAAMAFFRKSFKHGRPFLAGFITLFCGALMILAVTAAAPLVMKGWTAYLAGMLKAGAVNNYAAALTLWGALLFIATAGVWACFTALVIVIYGFPIRKTGAAAARFSIIALKRPGRFILLSLAAILFIVLLLNMGKQLQGILTILLPYGFFARWVFCMALAAGKTALALFLLYGVRILLSGNEERITAELEKTRDGLPVFPVLLVVLTVGFIFGAVRPYILGEHQLPDNIQARIVQADNLKSLGRGSAAAAEYIKAEADLLAFRGYLTGIGEISKAEGLGGFPQAEELFAQAAEAYAVSPYIPYFKGMLSRMAATGKEKSPDVNKLFAEAVQADKGTRFLPEARIWTINGYRAAGEGDQAGASLNLVIAGGIFCDRFQGLADAGERKLAVLLQECDKLAAMLAERKIDILWSRAEYEKAADLLPDFLKFAENNPAPASYCQVALVAERIPYPQYMYEYAAKFYQSRVPADDEKEEITAALFTSYMYVKSGHTAEAAALLEELYGRYPGNMDIISDYAYTLLENKQPKQAAALIEKHLAKAANDKEKDGLLYLQAIAGMETKEYNAALQAMEGICLRLEDAVSAADDLQMKEDYLYRFLLEYLHLCRADAGITQKFVGELQQSGSPVILYHYILGLAARQEEDYAASNSHFEKLLKINPRLAYPYYFLGVNYNEMAGYLKKDCYPQAERYFLKFTDLRPDVVEGFFSLGSVYKHTGDWRRAARAYLRVTDYNPYRNNPLYEPFGMQNHSLNELERIRRETATPP